MSKNFSPLEKTFARFLSNTPGLKRIIKKAYSFVLYLWYKKKWSYSSTSEIKKISVDNYESFFGYYDKKPDNGEGLVLVHLSSESTTKLPRDIDYIYINVYSLKNESFILKKPIKVRAFNWQQGCRTHWLTKDKFIFNDYDFERNEYCSFVYSLKKGCVEDKIKVPVQDSFSDKYIISICYKKLASLRPDYGYFRHKNENENENENEIGIWKYSFSSKSLELIITIKELLAFEFDLNDKHCKHKVNHVMISPNGEYFIFMHRYYNQSGKRFDRLILADNSGKLLKVIADFGMVSHCFWYDSNTIIGYLRSSEGKDSYWLINIKTAKFSLFKPWEDTNGDGHPSVYNDFILTDTYPDKSRMQTLYLTNKKSNLDISLGEFFHGFKFSNETRCDLHPRFSLCGNFVFFDSVYTGKRQLHYLDISKYKSEL